ncbi:diaminobutyrate acetyltransferase [Sulfitobacter aestuarii]|uniref:L-2,4-diaminobutyric acid acetyltransferase n=1 Tax=Sulfitobacter aestuarii TaxID=2161676 RepID=A0ABW5U453_9RHOB
MTETRIKLRKPSNQDGSAVWELVRSCKPLDENSMYCNLVQCDHFADTCVLAEMNGAPVGWISAYVRPDDPETLFVWQVAVSPLARGCGLGRRMLGQLIARDACADVNQIQTTITKDNDASWGLFSSFAERQGAEIDSEAYYKSEEHFDGTAKTEHLVTIPLAEPLSAAA